MRMILIAAIALLATPAGAQTAAAPRPVTVEQQTLAAGYKALMVCGAVHNARANGVDRSVDSIQANELTGIYPEIDGLVRDLPVVVDENGAHVPAQGDRPERRAVYLAGRGCAILPVGGHGRSPAEPLARRISRPEWRTGSPRGDMAALDLALSSAHEGGYGAGSNTTALVVVQDGSIVSEWYKDGFGPDTPQRTWSVGKSLAGTVVGAAVQAGLVDVAAPPTGVWRGADDPRASITLDQLLRMSSGLTSDTAGNRTDGLYFGGALISEQARAWPLVVAPGTRYRYANNDTLLALLGVLNDAEDEEAVQPNALFDRIGMTHTVAETDWRGDYMLSSQVWTTARDLARFGQLYLDDGVVDGERLLPQSWRQYVSRPSGPQPTGAQGYGATFWLMNQTDGVPPDTITANGNRGQYVVIVPSRRIVIVRRGEDPAASRFDFIAFTQAVLAALE